MGTNAACSKPLAFALVGIVFYTEGFNNLKNDPARAGVLFEQGTFAMENAKKFKDLEARNLASAEKFDGKKRGDFNPALSGDSELLSSERAGKIFDEFEKNFGIGRDTFQANALKAGSDLLALADGLGKKVSLEQVEGALDASKALDGAERSGKLEKSLAVSMRSGLRDRIKSKLAEAQSRESSISSVSENRDSDRKTASAGLTVPAGRNPSSLAENVRAAEPSLKDMKADSKEFFGSGEDPAMEELTLFAVVRRKYREKESFLR